MMNAINATTSCRVFISCSMNLADMARAEICCSCRSFAFPPSAIIKRKPLSPTARRAGWVGCNFDSSRIPAEARIWLVRTPAHGARSAAVPAAGSGGVPPRENTRSETLHEPAGVDARATDPIIVPPAEVREKFKRVKPLKDISVTQRGWTLDVLNIVRRHFRGRDGGLRRPRPKRAQFRKAAGFTAGDIAARCPYQHLYHLGRLRLHSRTGDVCIPIIATCAIKSASSFRSCVTWDYCSMSSVAYGVCREVAQRPHRSIRVIARK